ncbi:transcriptional regulator [Amycolatopsis alkalitolerans]|uniref:Transcriptional regulator n=1 Tax=Amycolatopsis alkalitolerans TaxID=2547244 RepID=A0A5C4LZ06_9PSEU|nr:transcriptional regulator [Amycolatopsis alkalitolerans]
MLAVFASLVEPIGRSLPPNSEVVLHDLSMLPNSIVAVHGDVTGRSVGDPATDLLLEHLMRGAEGHLVDYETKLPDGRRLRSSTMIIKDVAGTPAAALCINTDVSAWETVRRIAESMAGETTSAPGAEASTSDAPRVASPRYQGPKASTEAFVHDVDELAAILIERTIAEVGLPVELMRKEHKMRVVEQLRERGMFLLKDAVEMVATALSVTRFTIYNYLNEIAGQIPDSADRGAAGKPARRKDG